MRTIDRLYLFQADDFRSLAEDPRTCPMLKSWREALVTERASCAPSEEPQYDVIVAKMDRALDANERGK